MKKVKVFALLVVASFFLTIHSSISLLSHVHNNVGIDESNFTISAPTGEQWQMVYGGVEDDRSEAVVLAPDGTFAVAGYTKSFGAGENDVWFVRVGSDGTVLSNQTYGSPSDDEAYDMCSVSSGGFALAGMTQSVGYDAYVVRLHDNGSLMWDFPYVTVGDEAAYSIIEDQDGNLVMVGYHNLDGRVTKINATTGIEMWSLSYDGPGYVVLRDVVEVSDGYAILGYSFAGADNNFWLLKIDFDGNHLWNQTFDGNYNDFGFSIIEGNAGGLVLAGTTQDVSGYYDIWLIFTDDLGNEISNHTFGGSTYELLADVTPSRDNDGYLLVGSTDSYGSGGDDMYFVRTDNSGNIMWDMTNGSITDDSALGAAPLSDGGFIITGLTDDGPNGWDLRMNRLWYDIEGPDFSNLPGDVFFYRTELAYYQVHANDHSGIRNWWINDSDFHIFDNGYVLNASVLDIGTYVVQVDAMDKYFNTASGLITFTIGLETTPTTTPTNTTSPTSPATNTTAPPPPDVRVVIVFGSVTITAAAAVAYKAKAAKKGIVRTPKRY